MKKKQSSSDVNENYYDLKTKSVDDLVDAKPDNTPRYSEAELGKYKSGSKIRIPNWLKALLLKAWFAGMVCFFFIWGLGIYIPSQLDLFFVTSIAMGFVTDILVNNIFRFYESEKGANDRWMMFPKKSYINLVLNVLYAFWVMSFVRAFYNFVNTVIVKNIVGDSSVFFGVEPVTFGLIYLGFDTLFIEIKRLGKRILDDARRKQQRGV